MDLSSDVAATCHTPSGASVRLDARRSLFVFGDFEVDDARRIVRRGGEVIALRSREYDLLMALVRRGGRLARREEIMRDVWGYAPDTMTRTLDCHIARLRRHLRDRNGSDVIITLRGIGHRLAYDVHIRSEDESIARRG